MHIAPCSIVGPSGSGKSSSIENLPKDRTAILNTQQKVLPFKQSTPFKYNKFIKDKANFDSEFQLVKNSKDYDFIVLESFDSYMINLVDFAKKAFSGWDVWNFVYDSTKNFLKELQSIEDKFIFVLSLDEIVTIENPNGTRRNERRIVTAGKQMEKLSVESFFTTVLFTEKVTNAKDNTVSYNFRTNADSTTSVKSPKGMFKDLLIPNDLALVAKAMKEYWPEIKVNVNEGKPLSIQAP